MWGGVDELETNWVTLLTKLYFSSFMWRFFKDDGLLSLSDMLCVILRYFLRVTIVRRLSDLVKEYELIVHQLATYPDVNNSIKMEVGIEDCLHIEFEYNKSK